MDDKRIYNGIMRIRIIATLVIVAYHCACPYHYWNWGGYLADSQRVAMNVNFIFLKLLCNTMLPVFFMIAGFLFYSRKEHYCELKATLWKKFDRLMIPFAIITAVCVSLNLPMIGVASASGHLWFIRELFIFFCIALLLYRVKEHWIMGLGIVSYGLYVLQSRLGFITGEVTGHFLMYFIFFIGGHYMALYHNRIRENRIRYAVLFLWIAALVAGIQSVYTILFNIVLIGFIPCTSIKNKFMLSVNQYSFGIYLLHHVVIFAVFPLPMLQYLYAHHALLAITLMFMIALSVSWVICCGLKKIGFKYF